MEENTTLEIATKTADASPLDLQLLSAGRHLSETEDRLSLFGDLTGAYKLNVAENVLIFDQFRETFRDSSSFDLKDTKYAQPYFGDLELRQRVARLLQSVMKHPDGLVADHLTGVSGTSAALECLAFALFQPGDVAIIPAPRWQGFAWCFEQRRGMKIQSVAATGQAIKDACKALGKDARFALVLTNPDNPTGNNYPRSFLEEVYQLVLRDYPKAHIISDELYCYSQLGPARNRTKFVSAFELAAYRSLDRNRVHVVWGFAKDFGLSGFKAGFVISTNECVHAAIRDQARPGSPCRIARSGWFSPFDSLKNFTLGRLLAAQEGHLPEKAMHIYQARLNTAYDTFARELGKAGIKFNAHTSGAQFFWLDLREFLGRAETIPVAYQLAPELLALLAPPADGEVLSDDWAKEQALLTYLASGNGGRGVTLLPGRTLAAGEPGFFRLCFTCEPPVEMNKAVQRLIELLRALRRP